MPKYYGDLHRLYIFNETENDAFTVPKFTPINSAGFTVIGNGLDNTITGSDGHDTIDGGLGADLMAGGKGSDVYVVDDINDVVVEDSTGGAGDLIKSFVNFDLRATPFVEHLFLLNGTEAIGNNLGNIISGNNGQNTFWGGLGNDSVHGGGGDDTLYGEDGNDALDGNNGNDRMIGGLGDDLYIVDSVADEVVENAGEGTDTVGSYITHVLQDNFENLFLKDNFLPGWANNINGIGNDVANKITGNTGSNILSGNGGDDRLNGGLGKDGLCGGDGKDAFVFDVMGAKNADEISDFKVGEDKIWLDSSVFKKLDCGCSPKPMTLKEEFFTFGNEAQERDDYIIYRADGALLYDADGSGQACDAVIFGSVQAGTSLSNLDFVVF